MSLDLEAIVEAAAERVALRLEERIVARVQALLDERIGQRWLSRADAAHELGVSVDTIDRRVGDGSLQSRRIGRSVRVLVSAPATETEVAALAAEARAL